MPQNRKDGERGYDFLYCTCGAPCADQRILPLQLFGLGDGVHRHTPGEGPVGEPRFAHLPFCIIYGFGAMLGFALLRPFSGNYVLLYLVGAVLATLFEYLTARLMLRLFGTFWWDYTNKPFNYKGILCLESTLGWGLIALLLFAFLHRLVFRAVLLIPDRVGLAAAFLLVCAYAVDFAVSAYQAYQNAHTSTEAEPVPGRAAR